MPGFVRHSIFLLVSVVSLPAWSPTATAAAPARADLTGRVTAIDGQPVEGASVYVWTAGPKVGTTPYCPSCYVDCGKRARSAAGDGSFTLPQLDRELLFRLLIVRQGFAPRFVERVDATGGPVTIALTAAPPPPTDPACVLVGRVVGPGGKPVAGATVVPTAMHLADGGGLHGMLGQVMDPLAVTDDAGVFRIVSRKPAQSLDLRVEARGFARRVANHVPTGNDRDMDGWRAIRLANGAGVTVRLLRDGKPLAGAEVGLVQVDPSADGFIGVYTIGTDDAGRASFANVPTRQSYYVYGTMRTLAGRGATAVKPIDVGAAEFVVHDAGDLTVVPGRTLSGRVTLSDGKPVPPKTRLVVSRDKAWDVQIVELDDRGRFTVSDLPDEGYSVTVRVNGYHLSPKNVSLDRYSGDTLRGDLGRDVRDLVILLEPGRWERPKRDEVENGRLKAYVGPLRGAEGAVAPEP
jgi:hypothetical protein